VSKARLSALAALVLAAATPARADGLRAGFGVAPLPANVGEPMGGYGGLTTRRADEVFDPPEARALVLEGGGVRAGIVALDVVIARPNLRELVLADTRALGLDWLALVATHTHSGPGGYLPGWVSAHMTAGEFAPAMPDAIARAAADALAAAAADLAPARLASGDVPTALARNRRFADGANETHLALLRADFADGRAPILLFALGAHATLLSADSHGLSADWPGAARRALAAVGWRALFVPGPLGDQEPAVELATFASVADERAAMQAFGKAVAGAAAAGAQALAPRGAGELVALERWVATPAPALRSFCSLWWLSPLVGSSLDAFVSKRVPFQGLRAGGAELVLVPAEPSSTVGTRLRAALPQRLTPFVIAHANDWLGYVVDAPTYRRGGYEACLDFFGPGTSDWLADAAAETVRELDARAGAAP
jgi:hypothetical protein